MLSAAMTRVFGASPILRAEIARVLGIGGGARKPEGALSAALVGSWYRTMAREFHPDHLGSHEGMLAVNRGRELLLELIESEA